MSIENGAHVLAGFTAGEAIPNKGTAVRVSTTADMQLLIADNAQDADGWCMNTPALGEAVEFHTWKPLLKVRVGTGGVTRGDEISLEDGGAIVTPALNDVIVGKACESKSAGETGTILAGPGGGFFAQP